jgi:ABC-type phosphate/phosphonate transport system substrate-binding protein
MYDWPEVQWAHDALWSAIAERLTSAGIAAPERLDRVRPFAEVWRDPGLVLSQTCGFPVATALRGLVRLVATPVYEVEGCEGPLYSSTVVARLEAPGTRLSDFIGCRIAFNSRDSLSGYVTLNAALRSDGIDPAAFTWIETGSHRASIRAVAAEEADIAAIDAVCWALAHQYQPEGVSRLKVIARTALRPGLPFVTAGTRSESELQTVRRALSEALTTPETAAAREALHLAGLAVLEGSHAVELRRASRG